MVTDYKFKLVLRMAGCWTISKQPWLEIMWVYGQFITLGLCNHVTCFSQITGTRMIHSL